jgi:hypothetical protein
MAPNGLVAHGLLLVGGTAGLHHYYIGNWARGVMYGQTLGLFGLGCAYDACTLRGRIRRLREAEARSAAVAAPASRSKLEKASAPGDDAPPTFLGRLFRGCVRAALCALLATLYAGVVEALGLLAVTCAGGWAPADEEGADPAAAPRRVVEELGFEDARLVPDPAMRAGLGAALAVAAALAVVLGRAALSPTVAPVNGAGSAASPLSRATSFAAAAAGAFVTQLWAWRAAAAAANELTPLDAEGNAEPPAEPLGSKSAAAVGAVLGAILAHWAAVELRDARTTGKSAAAGKTASTAAPPAVAAAAPPGVAGDAAALAALRAPLPASASAAAAGAAVAKPRRAGCGFGPTLGGLALAWTFWAAFIVAGVLNADVTVSGSSGGFVQRPEDGGSFAGGERVYVMKLGPTMWRNRAAIVDTGAELWTALQQWYASRGAAGIRDDLLALVWKEDDYAALGLARGASWDEVRAAHRRVVKQNHPDRLPASLSKQEAAAAVARFRRAQAAYESIAAELGQRVRGGADAAAAGGGGGGGSGRSSSGSSSGRSSSSSGKSSGGSSNSNSGGQRARGSTGGASAAAGRKSGASSGGSSSRRTSRGSDL